MHGHTTPQSVERGRRQELHHFRLRLKSFLCVSVDSRCLGGGSFLLIFTTEALRTQRDTEEIQTKTQRARSQTIPHMFAQLGIFDFYVLQSQHHICIEIKTSALASL